MAHQVSRAGAGAGVGSPAWIPVTFTTPATVTAGTLYAIVVGWQLPAASWLRWEVDASWGTSGCTGYTNYDGALGEAMVGTQVSGAYNWYDLFQIASVNDSQTGNADFAFRTYVGAAETTPVPTITQPPTDASP